MGPIPVASIELLFSMKIGVGGMTVTEMRLCWLLSMVSVHPVLAIYIILVAGFKTIDCLEALGSNTTSTCRLWILGRDSFQSVFRVRVRQLSNNCRLGDSGSLDGLFKGINPLLFIVQKPAVTDIRLIAFLMAIAAFRLRCGRNSFGVLRGGCCRQISQWWNSFWWFKKLQLKNMTTQNVFEFGWRHSCL